MARIYVKCKPLIADWREYPMLHPGTRQSLQVVDRRASVDEHDMRREMLQQEVEDVRLLVLISEVGFSTRAVVEDIRFQGTGRG